MNPYIACQYLQTLYGITFTEAKAIVYDYVSCGNLQDLYDAISAKQDTVCTLIGG